jgi:predicted dinucleotide-binding enzyme
LAAKLAELGHDVVVGTRNMAETMANTAPSPYGLPPFSVWRAQNPGVRVGTFADAAGHGELVINATNGMGSLQALQQSGADNFAGKILIDISNPLDFSQGMPPTLAVLNTDSLGEQIQRALPAAKVVKTLNTLSASLMVNPRQLAGGNHALFVSGDDAAAKAQVSAWLAEWFGWQYIIDLGDITTARGTEMYLPLWLRLWGALGTGDFNIQVVQ